MRDLIRRIEEQAITVAKLKKEIRSLRERAEHAEKGWDRALADQSEIAARLVEAERDATYYKSLAANAPPVYPAPTPADCAQLVKELWVGYGATNNKIGAIKVVRRFFNLGLKEAKDLVEANLPHSAGIAKN